jgi:hypothetical protein
LFATVPGISPDASASVILRTIVTNQTGGRSMNDKPKPAIEMVPLKQLCAELKVDPREARERLRLAVRDAKKNPELAKSALDRYTGALFAFEERSTP